MEEIDDCMNQVYRMALGAMQSFTFWLYSRPNDSPYEKSIKTYGHFFHGTNEAHLTMIFISLDALLDAKEKYQNFERLLTLLPGKVSAEDLKSIEARVEALQKKAKGIGIIRNHSFAHLTQRATREEVGKKYGQNNGELMGICYQALEIATDVSRMRGRTVSSAEEMVGRDVDDIQGLMAKLEASC
jgi:hypothetical protein